MFGSTVIVSVGALTSATNTLVGVKAGPSYGEFHSHGGIVAVDASKGTGVVNAVGIDVNKGTSGDAKAHAFETAWVVKAGTGGGTVTRVKGNGNHESPFLWQSGTDVPVPGLVSLTGADMFVETDCNSSGCSGGSDPHLMIYKSACTSSGWFDLVRQACR
jgi:hypothetical protein